MNKTRNGFVYVASDPKKSPSPNKFNADKKILNREFEHSFQSVKKHHPNIPVTLFTNYDDLLKNEIGVDNVVHIESDWGFLPKVKGLNMSPYERTVFLDCDTQVNRSLDNLFNYLDDYDLVVCQEFFNKSILNTGVFAVNTKSPFLGYWLKKMNERKAWAERKVSKGARMPNKIPDDQAEFNEIIRKLGRSPYNRHIREAQDTLVGFKYKILDSRIYNCRVKELQECKQQNFNLDDIKVFHFRNLWRNN
jgi:hypothetical protein